MSKTVHYTGKLKPTGKTLKEYKPDADDVYDMDLYENVVEVDGLIYEVEKKSLDPYDNIFKSSKNEDGTIDFEVKYYNGGCGFVEAIDEALSNHG